jgi:DNA-binding response OmpR family regulator
VKKILIVEDDFDIAKVVRRRCTDAGFETAIATDAYQGIQMVHQEKPDCVILDLGLPAGGGLGVLKALRMNVQTRLCPVIILTAARDEALKKKVLDEGVEAYLEKPYDSDELLKAIQKCLGV